MTYITLDFGSSNSGAVLNTQGREYQPDDLLFIHRQDGNGFLKQPTVFWIKRSLLDEDVINEDNINIYSCVFYEPKDMSIANFVWCKDQTAKMLPTIYQNRDEWVKIKHPKMELYRLGEKISNDSMIKGDDGKYYLIRRILYLFFSVIKKECIHKIHAVGNIVSFEDAVWNITLPGLAIWNQSVVDFLRNIAKSVFGDRVAFYSEAECALIGINLAGNAGLNFEENRHSIVVDLGGGTADICVMKESVNEDGTNTFDEQKTTKDNEDSTTSICAGGNDIDKNFITFFCEYLAEGIDLDDTPVICMYNAFASENPAGAMTFDTQWKNLQNSEIINENNVTFSPGRQFVDWLKIHYPHAARKKDDYGEFSLDGKALYENVFRPVYEKICHSVEIHIEEAYRKGLDLKFLYFAGGLSLDKNLKRLITALVKNRYPNIKIKETSGSAVIGAVQRGGNHIAVNEEKLIRRMARKTFYTSFALQFNGNESELRATLISTIREVYYLRVNTWLTDEEINNALNEQWSNMQIDYTDGTVSYLSPLCVRFAPVSKKLPILIHPIDPDKQTGLKVKVYSSTSGLNIFENNNDNVIDEGEFSYDFGHCWNTAKLVFDPTFSSAVEGTASFYLTDSDDQKKLKEFIIHNVSKRGF
jgi:hypothetical protein